MECVCQQKSGKIHVSYLSGIALLVLFTFNQNLAWAEYKPVYGLDYSPFREGQSPETGVFPTLAQIEEDIGIIRGTTQTIRTYGNDNVLYNIPAVCNSEDIECYVGSWISDDSAWNQGVVDDLIEVADCNYITTKALLVGNEYLLWRPFSSETTLISLINQVKEATDLPVSTGETYNVWLDHPNLAAAADFIGAHIHPYWEGVAIGNAAQHVIDKCNLLKQNYPNKEIIILEVGWPSDGPACGAAIPSSENQIWFLKEFVYLAKQNDIKYFIFEALDEPWKGKYAEVEKHWGLWDKDRALKPLLFDYLYADAADIDKDSVVDILDLLGIVSYWLEPSNPEGPYLPGDISQDGIADLFDFSVISRAWLNE